MSDPRTDAIAAEAARLLDAGRAADIDDAIRGAAELLGYEHAPLPGAGRVRNHARALAMQALGEEGYRASIRNVWEIAERLMTVLAEAMPEADQLLVGRAAEGLIDAGVTVHVRLYTKVPIGDVARTLVEFGYDEPTFETAETRLGRLSRLKLIDDGVEIVVTRLLPHMAESKRTDLFTGKRIKTATLDEVRAKL